MTSKYLLPEAKPVPVTVPSPISMADCYREDFILFWKMYFKVIRKAKTEDEGTGNSVTKVSKCS